MNAIMVVYAGQLRFEQFILYEGEIVMVNNVHVEYIGLDNGEYLDIFDVVYLCL